MTPGITHLLYLHGFRSSPQSTKASKLAAWVRQHRPDITWWCPQLPPSPREAMELVLHRVLTWPAANMAVIGSSLGGFYAGVVANRVGCRAVLLNPAVDPARDLAAHIGQTKAWHSEESFVFRPEFVDELRAFAPSTPRGAAPCLAIIAKGDEVLAWREMLAHCAACRIKLLEGGDHALSDFGTHLSDIVAFLGLE
jgi:predicted esterase YcpF (UPF0227 family)